MIAYASMQCVERIDARSRGHIGWHGEREASGSTYAASGMQVRTDHAFFQLIRFIQQDRIGRNFAARARGGREAGEICGPPGELADAESNREYPASRSTSAATSLATSSTLARRCRSRPPRRSRAAAMRRETSRPSAPGGSDPTPAALCPEVIRSTAGLIAK